MLNMSKGGERLNFPVIEAERIKHKMSKEELSHCLGVSRRTIQNWQYGRTEMPLSKLMKLSEEWNCSIDYLLGLAER